MGAMAVAIYSLKNRLYTVRIRMRDMAQMNRLPSRVTAHRGMDSKKPTFSMVLTMLSGRAASVTADRPEAPIMDEIAP